MIDLSLIAKNDRILCGLSGGADSIMMVHALKMLEKKHNITVFACHLNHLTRDKESLRDQNFSKDFCEKFDIPFYTESISISENLNKSIGFEATAREIRYDFFERASKFFGANKIATAHNADDNLETILLNISRGTGLNGLLGIPSCRQNIIRPILNISRAEIEKYLKNNNILYILDSSNLSDDYSRNKIRHHISPILCEINSSAISNFTKMCKNLKNDYDFIENFANITYNNIVAQNNSSFKINKNELLALDLAISFRVVSKILENFDLSLTNDKFNKILKLCDSQNPSAKLEIYNNLQIKRIYDDIIFCQNTENNISSTFEVYEDYITISTNISDNIYNEYFVDFESIDFPSLHLRTRKTGDEFIFKNHRKSLKKLYIDNKIPKEIRDFIPILADKNGIIAELFLGVNYNRLGKQKIIFRSI